MFSKVVVLPVLRQEPVRMGLGLTVAFQDGCLTDANSPTDLVDLEVVVILFCRELDGHMKRSSSDGLRLFTFADSLFLELDCSSFSCLQHIWGKVKLVGASLLLHDIDW